MHDIMIPNKGDNYEKDFKTCFADFYFLLGWMFDWNIEEKR